jgi:antirestriction protein ArdC
MDSTTDKKTEVLATLADGVARLTNSDEWRAWLDVQSRFHRYSFGNTLLIALQRPDATQVAGFHAWLGMGRHVRKGEKGIAILAPVVRRTRVKDEATGDETVVTGSPSAFRIAHVFDVVQTDGDELPAVPVHKLEGDDTDGLYGRLIAVAHSVGFTVEEEYLENGVNGDCNHTDAHIRIEVRNEPRQQVKTLAHELAHAILHGDRNGLTRERAELEAESVAYVVCTDLGIDSSSYSFGYLATWSGGGTEAQRAITESAQRIQKAAHLILDDSAANSDEVAA